MIGQTQMAAFYENERTWTVANPADVAGEIDESTETNFTEGTTVVHMDGLTTASNILPGMVFTWEGIYACHPETNAAYAHQQQFVVVSVANPSSGDADITFSPAIDTTGPKKNVVTSTGGTVTWTAAGQDGKDIHLGLPEGMTRVAGAGETLGGDRPLLGPRTRLQQMEQPEPNPLLHLVVAGDLDVGAVPEGVQIRALTGQQCGQRTFILP